MEQTSEGHLRIVSMSGIQRWTDEIGRRIDLPAVSEPVEDIARPSNDIDLTEPASTEAGVDEPVAAEGSMLVPLDAWNRMLNQLGNLHEAGQQLAEARERAAKAETEAHFLKERLADLRDELERAKEPTADETTREPTHERPSDEGVSTPSSPTALMRALYDGWRSRRRDRA
jgi:hypothetical protein